MAETRQLRLPVQAESVNRLEVPELFFINFGPFEVIPEVDPQPDPHSYFMRQANQAAGICSILSAYAVGPCLMARRSL